MSEQTPDTSNNIADGHEPSMEDILASIRKIIADDDVVADNVSSDFEESVGLSEDLIATGFDVAETPNDAEVTELNAFEAETIETLDLDILPEDSFEVDSEIEELLTSADTVETENLDVTSFDVEAASTDNVFDDILDLEIPMEEEASPLDVTELLLADTLDETASEEVMSEDSIEAVDIVDASADGDIFEMLSSPEGLGADLNTTEDVTLEADESIDFVEGDELALMLDDMLDVDDSPSEEASVIEALDEDVSSDDAAALSDVSDENVSLDEDEDMNLVKSLMADLTEEPLHEDEVSEEDTSDAELASDAELVSEVPEDEIDEDIDTDDVMDEILSMALDDEIELQEDISIPEIDESVETIVSDETQRGSALLDIAAEAEADASAVSSGVLAGLGAAAIGGAALAADSDDDAHIDTALEDLDELIASENTEDLTPEPPETEMSQEETPDMARAAKKDTIIDEVTETATAGAFASLSNVVEEKAVVAERGDRVGDLVMEALRPMLKEWLDANLKGIVERAVTKEVKRISSGK